MQQSITSFPVPASPYASQGAPPVGSGGFLDPQRVAAGFGVQPGMQIADFGSGAGYFTIILAKMVGDGGVVTAVDILNSALETLQSKAKVGGLSNIQTVRSNLEVLGSSGLPNDSQDMVLLANVLFQNPSKGPIIAEARRALKPGGSLIVIDWRKGVNGFGPPDALKEDPEEIKQLVMANDGLRFSHDIDAGIFHFGQIYKKI